MHPIIAANDEKTVGVSILSAWIIFSCVAGAIARNKGNSFAGAFFISVLLSPLIGIIFALVQKPNEVAIEQGRLQSGSSKKCPFCAELIKKEARICRFCGREVPQLRLGDTQAATAPKYETAKAVDRLPKDESAERMYLFLKGKVQGPYTTKQVEALVKSGSATLESLCCIESTNVWQPVKNFAS